MANDDAYERACEKNQQLTRAENVWDIDQTITKDGITKAQVTVPYDDKYYRFTYSAETAIKEDGARKFYYAVQVDELPANNVMRKLGIKRKIWGYTKESCFVPIYNLNKQGIAERKILLKRLTEKNFSRDSNDRIIVTGYGVHADELKECGNFGGMIMEIDEIFRDRIAQKAEELDRAKHPERYQEKQEPIQGSGAAPFMVGPVECQPAVWKRVKGKVSKKVGFPEGVQVISEEEQRKQRQEKGRAMYEKWKNKQSAGKEDK